MVKRKSSEKKEPSAIEYHTHNIKHHSPVIELQNIYKIYKMGENEVAAIKNMSLKVYKGEFLAIIGK